MPKLIILLGRLSLTFLVLAGWQTAASGANAPSTRLLRTPTVSATHIAFAYANNLWIVERAGGTARRLTSFQGQTTNPHFSPDGRWLAFSAEYAGNTDVYVVPAEPEIILTTTDYGVSFASIVGRDQLFGLQFHPEKSQVTGQTMLANFAKL